MEVETVSYPPTSEWVTPPDTSEINLPVVLNRGDEVVVDYFPLTDIPGILASHLSVFQPKPRLKVWINDIRILPVRTPAGVPTFDGVRSLRVEYTYSRCRRGTFPLQWWANAAPFFHRFTDKVLLKHSYLESGAGLWAAETSAQSGWEEYTKAHPAKVEYEPTPVRREANYITPHEWGFHEKQMWGRTYAFRGRFFWPDIKKERNEGGPEETQRGETRETPYTTHPANSNISREGNQGKGISTAEPHSAGQKKQAAEKARVKPPSTDVDITEEIHK